MWVLVTALVSAPAAADTYVLAIDETTFNATGRDRPALAVNGSIPAPLLRFKEGEDVVIHVTNNLDDQDASIHWHGFILPYTQDGVPGISFDGIKPGETFTYRFKVVQNGTYWYHSHSGLQEQAGVYGPIIIEPKGRDPVRYDREHVVMFSDWTDERPEAVLAHLKKQSDYYNRGKRTVFDFFEDVRAEGWRAAFADRLMWGAMRMDPTDLSDVSGYTFLINGKNSAANWTGLFSPGERVRLRFINGSAMTYFDVRIPGLEMTIVAADGQNVRPVTVDELRIAVAETYDVIVTPADDRAYTIFAESLDRTGYVRGTLATRPGIVAAVPQIRPRQLLTMADMGNMDDHGQMSTMSHGPTMKMDDMDTHEHSDMNHGAMGHEDVPTEGSGHTMSHEAMSQDEHTGGSGPRVFRYEDLKSLIPYPQKPPTREIELSLTGNMERFIWSINGKKYSDSEPIRLAFNERVRVAFVNTTMMNHPMHLHGHWMELDAGGGAFKPRKHVINVRPGQTVYFDLTADALGEWAFHCHLLYHMATGMFRKVVIEREPVAFIGEG